MTTEETKELLGIALELAISYGSLEILSAMGDAPIYDEVNKEADRIGTCKDRVLALIEGSVFPVAQTENRNKN